MPMRAGLERWLGFALLVVGFAACARGPAPADAGRAGGGPPSPADAGSTCPLESELRAVSPAAAAGTLLGSLTVDVLGALRTAQLLRLPTADGRVTYAEWIPPQGDGGSAPAVLLTQPYDGIDWTGEAVDARWAAACPDGGTCYLPDVDGPGGGPDAGVIAYAPLPPATFASEAAVHLANGVGVLGVFGRFYAGGSWWGYAQDMVAGLRFLATRPEVDRERIGILGGSLGGYEAFYGAAYAPSGVAPRVVVAMYPPVDLQDEVRWATVEEPALVTTAAREQALAAFFDPYLRRAEVDVGALDGGDYRCFAPDQVVPRVTGQVLTVQDDWDLIVDPALTRGLDAQLGSLGSQLWYLHPTPPDVDTLPISHGPFDGPSPFPSLYTFGLAFLHLRLGQGAVIVPYDGPTMTALLARWRDQTRAGLEQPGAAERLADLADARLSLYEWTSGQISPGAVEVSQWLSSVWNVAVDPASAQSVLLDGGLPE